METLENGRDMRAPEGRSGRIVRGFLMSVLVLVSMGGGYLLRGLREPAVAEQDDTSVTYHKS